MTQPESRARSKEALAALRIDRSAAPPRRRPRAPLWTTGVLAALLIGGVAAYGWSRRSLPVRVAYALRSQSADAPATEVLTGSGYIVTADRYISLGVRVPSRIVEYLVEEGQRVQRGDVLVKLDARQYAAALSESKAALSKARADVALYERELARTRELHERDIAPDAELDLKRNQLGVARAEVARLEAEIQRQRVDLEDTVIRAPTDGMILEKLKEVGEIAVPGGFQGSGELIRMANLDHLRAELDINEADLSRISLGQPARVVPEAYPDRSFAARVVKLYPQINRQKGTLKVEVEILEPDERLRPDMSARVSFLSEPTLQAAGEDAGVITLPAEAVRRSDGKTFIWVVTRGVLRKQPIELATPAPGNASVSAGSTPPRAYVLRGLSGGEAVVLGDTSALEDGDRVEIVD